jgi:hypothetical protein
MPHQAMLQYIQDSTVMTLEAKTRYRICFDRESGFGDTVLSLSWRTPQRCELHLDFHYCTGRTTLPPAFVLVLSLSLPTLYMLCVRACSHMADG